MPTASTAALTSRVIFSEDIGEPIWQERRRLPVTAAYGVAAAFLAALAVLAVTVGPLRADVALTTAMATTVGALVRAQRRGLIETYTLGERFIAIEHPGGGPVALPIEPLTSVTLAGDSVLPHSTVGTLRPGFVARERALVRALGRVAPGVPVERDVSALCPTCTLRY